MANRIKEFREKHNCSQQKLGQLMGVTQQAISRWENGACSPSIPQLVTMADIFECTTDQLVGRDTA